MGKDHIHTTVGKFQEPNMAWAKRHEKDLCDTILTLENELMNDLWKGKGAGCGIPIITRVAEISDIIEETTLTKVKVGHLERNYKEVLVKKQFHKGAEYGKNTVTITGFPQSARTSKLSEGRQTWSRMLHWRWLLIDMYDVHCWLCYSKNLTEEEIAKVNERYNKIMEEKRTVQNCWFGK